MGKQQQRIYLHGWGFSHGVFSLLHVNTNKEDSIAPCLYQAARSSGAYTCSAIAEHIANKIQKETVMVGWSLGGQVALEAAARSSKVVAIILLASAPLMVNRLGWSCTIDNRQYESLVHAFQKDAGKTITRVTMLTAHGEEKQKQAASSLSRFCASMEHKQVLESLLVEMAQNDLRDLLMKLEIPILFVLGRNDALVKPEMSRVLTGKHIQYEFIDSSGHAPFVSHAALVNKAIERFISSVHA